MHIKDYILDWIARNDVNTLPYHICRNIQKGIWNADVITHFSCLQEEETQEQRKKQKSELRICGNNKNMSKNMSNDIDNINYCLTCGKKFKVSKKFRKFCSKECAHTGKLLQNKKYRDNGRYDNYVRPPKKKII